MEHLVPVFIAEVLCYGLEAIEDGVEVGNHAIDGEITGEHASISTKSFDSVQHNLSIGLDCPGLILDTDAGYLDGDIRKLGSNPDRVAPNIQSGLAAIGRQPGMIDDDLCCRELICQFGGLM